MKFLLTLSALLAGTLLTAAPTLYVDNLKGSRSLRSNAPANWSKPAGGSKSPTPERPIRFPTAAPARNGDCGC